MSTANQNNAGGASAPGDEIGDDLMQEVASNLGTKLISKPAADGDGFGNGNGEGGEGEQSSNLQPPTSNIEGEGEGGEGGEETAEQKSVLDPAEADAAAKTPGKADKDAVAAELAAELAAKLKDAPAEVREAAQAVVDELIDRVVVTERAEKDRLGARVTELTAELEAAQKAKGPAVVGAINPVFLADDATAIDDREEQIEKFERWAAKHAAGANLPDAENYDPQQPTYTAEQIEQRLDQVLQEKKKILPAARANLQKRAEIDQALRGLYPAVFDPKAPEYAQVQQVLKALPELKQFADYRVIALKQILGARAFAELLQKRQKEPSPTGQTKGNAPPPKKSPPRAPGGGAPAKGSVLDPKSKQTAAPQAMQRVMKDPSDKKAFAAAVGALVADL